MHCFESYQHCAQEILDKINLTFQRCSSNPTWRMLGIAEDKILEQLASLFDVTVDFS